MPKLQLSVDSQKSFVLAPAHKLSIPQRKLVLKQGKLDVPYTHKINYRSAYDYDKITTTQLVE